MIVRRLEVDPAAPWGYVMFIRSSIAALALAIPTAAQSIYLDLGATPPSSSFAAAAATPGVWNASYSAPGPSLALVDIQGHPTSAEFVASWGCDASFCATPPAGDAGLLFDDWLNADCYLVPQDLVFHGLQPGFYRVHVYGFGTNACDGVPPTSARTLSISSFSANAKLDVTPWTGSFANGNHVAFVTSVAAGVDLQLSFMANFYGGPAGIQLEQIPGDVVPYCFGAEGRCPCPGSASTTGGCATSFSIAGGSIDGSGNPTVGSDTFALTASNMSVSVATIFQGTTMASGKFPFGDGLRCTGGTLTRIALRFAPGGTLTIPQAGDPPISVAGFVPPGSTRYYQGWFRDASSFCTADTFNLTSAVAVVWH